MIPYIWENGKGRGEIQKMLKKEQMKIWERKKCGISQLEITVKAYSQKTLPSLAKEPDETTCGADMSRRMFHNPCWAESSPLMRASRNSGSPALLNAALPGTRRRDFWEVLLWREQKDSKQEIPAGAVVKKLDLVWNLQTQLRQHS